MIRFLYAGDWQPGMTRHFFSEGIQERFAQSLFDTIHGFYRIAQAEDCRSVVVCGVLFESSGVDLNSVLLTLVAFTGITVLAAEIDPCVC
jgi:hypothetical protein